MRVHFPASLLLSAAPQVLGADLPGEVMSGVVLVLAVNPSYRLEAAAGLGPNRR